MRLARRKGLITAAVLMAMVGVGLYLLSRADPLVPSQAALGWAFIYGGGVALLQVLDVVPHECGHALVAWLLRFEVLRIVIGVGAPFARTSVGSVSLEFGVPFGGSTLSVTRHARAYRLRYWLVVAAGPAATALQTLVFVWWSPEGKGLQAVRNMLVIGGLFLLVQNLLPYRRKGTNGIEPPSTDGWKLVTIPFLSAGEVRRRVAAFGLTKAMQQAYRQGGGSVVDGLNQMLVDDPGNTRLEEQLALAYVTAEQYDEAVAAYRVVLAKVDQLGHPAISQNNGAYCELLAGGDLEAADRWSAAAFGLVPGTAAVMGTRGSVLVELGQLEEGTRLLRAAHAQAETPRSRASCEAYLAVAAAAVGHVGSAQRTRAQVTHLVPELLLRRLDRAIREAPAAQASPG